MDANKIGVGLGAFALVLGAGLVVVKINQTNDVQSATVEPTRNDEPAHKEPEKESAKPVERKTSAPPPIVTAPPAPPKPMTVQQAIASAGFADSENGTMHPSAAMFTAWAIDNLTLEDVNIKNNPATTFEKVQRDSDLERGKRICIGGTVGEITGENFMGSRVYNGAIVSDEMHVVRFVAVGSADGVFRDKQAGFCGIAVGRESFANAAGGTTHAVRAVGLFAVDANQNRAAAVMKH